MEIQELEEAIRKDDFAIGDSFWLGNWEFEVVSRKGENLLCEEKAVFKWELMQDDFIQVIKDSHPEIKEPEEFFSKHRDELIYYFEKGFDALICECGIKYESVIRDALEEVIGKDSETAGEKNELFPNCRLQDFEASEEEKQHILAEDGEHNRNSDPTGQDSDKFCRQAERTIKSVSRCDVLTKVRESGKLKGQPIFIYGNPDGGYFSMPRRPGKYGQRLPAYVRDYQLANTAMSCRRGKRKLPGVYRGFWKKGNKPQHINPKLKILEPYGRQTTGNFYGHKLALYKSLESYLS